MQLKKGTEIEITVKYLNISGRGVAEAQIEGQDYFVAVDGLFPGDKAIIAISKIKKKYLEGELIKLLKKSPHRVPAHSDHAEICGGSQWEVLDYAYQLDIKQTEVTRILSNIQQEQCQILPIIPTENIWNYRNKMQYSFGYDVNMSPVLGLHEYGRKFDVFDVQDCHLADPICNELISFFRQECFANGLTPFSFRSNTGDLKDLTIRISKYSGDVLVVLTVTHECDLKLAKSILGQAAKTFTRVKSWYIEAVTTKRGTPTTKNLIHVSGEESIIETIQVGGKNLDFEITPEAFFQPNSEASAKIYNQVLDFAELSGNEVVYDLFCGTGTIGICLASKSKQVYGLDLVEKSIELAQKNSVRNKLSHTKFIAGDAFKVFKDLNWPAAEVVVVDPPRAGLSPGLIELIVKLSPKKIIYVSCNIKSFCQDILEFANHGYKLKTLQPVDQFPHTKHLEVVAEIVSYTVNSPSL